MPPRKPVSTEVQTPEQMTDIDFINKLVQGPDFVPYSWDEFMTQTEGEIIDFEGSPWEIVDKKRLVDVPFLIVDVRAYNGKFGEAVAVMVLTEEPLDGTERPMYVFNDGSTGVYRQVVEMIRHTGHKSGIRCPKGLRASEYTYEQYDAFEPDKAPILVPATTYYVA